MTLLTSQQWAVFARAVERRSHGQVRIPALDIAVHDAIALWQDLVSAFGQGRGRVLSSSELALLRQRAWRRAAGHIALSQKSLTLESGRALWNFAGKLEAHLARRPQHDPAHSALARAAGVAALGLAATQLAACTSLWGGNIKGNFSCSAPGGTCAPSTVIDDQAMAAIQSARPMVPAAAYFQPQARRSGQSARLVPASNGRIATAAPGMALRERRVLKVVFPAYVDGSGNFHEPRVVHTVADAGGWMQLSGGAADWGEQAEAQTETSPSPSPSLPASQARTTDEAALVPDQQHSQHAKPTDLSAAPSGQTPDPKVVAEARARGAARPSTSPLDAIRSEVEARLGATPKAAHSNDLPPSPVSLVPKPALDTQPAAQAAVPSSAAPIPAATNPPASFSGKVGE